MKDANGGRPARRAWLIAGASLGALASLPVMLRAATQGPGGDQGEGEEPNEDHRAWQHGIDLLWVDSRWLLIWGSAGNPPRPRLGGDWPHDIYHAWLELPGEGAELLVTPQVLVARPEAQEPPSAAINGKGAILVTAEDGEDGINQFAGLWGSQLRPLRPYPFTIRRGGHSGHVAALGERFLVVYGEGWQDGGGFMNRGTGRDIHARIVDGRGAPGPEIDLARGHRDGWPMVAASDRNWLAVWQRYDGLSLYGAVVGTTGRVSPPRRIAADMPIRYAYDVAYAAALGCYVVAGNSGGSGFIALLDRDGRVRAMQGGLPALVSEARVVIGEAPGLVQGQAPVPVQGQGRGPEEMLAVYPVQPHGLAVLRLSAAAVTLVKTIDHPHAWDYMGTTGRFVSAGRVLFATLTTRGIRAFLVDL